MNLVAQLFGLLALCTVVITMQIKERKKSLIFLIFVNLFFGINFLLLKAYSGTVINFLAVIQAIIFYIYNKKDQKIPKYIIVLFIICTLIIGIFIYSDIYSILPIAAGILNLFAMFTKNMKIFRTINFAICILWIIYDIVFGAYTALLSQIITIVSVSVAIIRYDIKKNKSITL